MKSQTNDLTNLEWLETNGIGGWAMSTVAGVNTRMYHGLLVAATRVPIERYVLVSHLDESVELNGQSVELFYHDYGSRCKPRGDDYLKSFERKLFPTFLYEPFPGVELEKTISAINGENTTVIRYRLQKSEGPINLKLRPLLACRYYHEIRSTTDGFSEHSSFSKGTLALKPIGCLPTIYIGIEGAIFREEKKWIEDFHYAVESYRGIESGEKLYQPGVFTLTLSPQSSFEVTLSTKANACSDGLRKLHFETKRREDLLERAGAHRNNDEAFHRLVLAADQFIVRRQADKRTIIAGYPWFTDWGRDTMIALEGLCLTTKRYDEARLILSTFVESLSQGMLPNRFPDKGEEPEYNTVDGTLWFFVAARKYLEYTKDLAFVKETIFPAFKEVIDWHEKGTRFGIREDADGLITAGSPEDQLTWMDAKVDDWVVTPRHGKAVEISALWYNALLISADLALSFSESELAEKLKKKASITRASFIEKFWNEDKGCCFDVIRDDMKDESIRPNQLLALSLPYPILEKERTRRLIKVVEEHLVTARGLRSLAPGETDYQRHYGGSRRSRDGAYHQGTVWSWLFGPYYFSVQRFGDTHSKEKANALLSTFLEHLDEGGVGSVSEIFDGDFPHHPRGCPAQAWGVAELLRCLSFSLGCRNL